MKLRVVRLNDYYFGYRGVIAKKILDWEFLEHLVFDEGGAKAIVIAERRYREMVDAYRRLKEKWLK